MISYSHFQADIDNDIAQWDEPGMKERRLARISSTSKDGYSPEVPQIIEIGNIMTPYESTPVEAINSTDGGLDEPNAAGKVRCICLPHIKLYKTHFEPQVGTFEIKNSCHLFLQIFGLAEYSTAQLVIFVKYMES